MDKEELNLPDPNEVKGIDTAEGEPVKSEEPVKKTAKRPLPKLDTSIRFKTPKTEQEAFERGIGAAAGSSASGSAVSGTNLLVSKQPLQSLFAEVDLAKAIPDPLEREKFISEHGTRMQQLMGDKYAIRFDKDFEDYAKFKEQKYNSEVKRFIDELDENQKWYESSFNNVAKLIGSTIWNTAGGLVPTAYGIGSALFNWDASKFYDNSVAHFWDDAQHKMDVKLAVYGGSSWVEDRNKNFFARFYNNPGKSLNQDVTPAVSFIAAVVLTEMAAGILAGPTGGTSLAASASRLGAISTNLFGKGLRFIRGVDQLSDMQNLRRLAELTSAYRKGIGFTASMVRTAGYESGLIARGTQEQTEMKAKTNVLLEKGYSYDQINEILLDPEKQKEVFSSDEIRKIKEAGHKAGDMSLFLNIPLVGASNMIQFSKAFSSGYRINKALERLNPLNIRGTVAQGGKVIARADAVSKFRRAAGYGATIIKSPISEGFEEYAQGVMEQGFSDYWSAPFSEDSAIRTASFIDTMTNASRNYVNSREGIDSITIGATMGLLGIRLPVRINKQTGKPEFGFESYGGARQEFKELREDVQKARAFAAGLEQDNINPIIQGNFKNFLQSVSSQEEMDTFLKKNDVFNYKNKEYESFHSYITKRVNEGVEDVVFQELDALEQIPLDNFNDQFAFKTQDKSLKFTEETRKETINKIRKSTESIIEAKKAVDTMFADSTTLVDGLISKYKGVLKSGEIENVEQLAQPLKEQMTFLYGANINLQEREKALEKEINDLTQGQIAPNALFKTSALNRLLAKIAVFDKVQGKTEFATTAKELYKASLNEWKENDPVSYRQHHKMVEPLLQDLVLMKERKAHLAALFESLFTAKGASKFMDLHDDLRENFLARVAEEIIKRKEEELANAKSSNKVDKVERDLESINPELAKEVAEKKLAKELTDAEKELQSNIASIAKEQGKTQKEVVDDLDANTIIKVLQKTPAVFNEILKRLKEKGKPVIGVQNIDQLAEAIGDDPDVRIRIANEFKELLKIEQDKRGVVIEKLDLVDPEQLEIDESEPTDDNIDDINSDDFYERAQKRFEKNSIFKTGTQVTEQGVIPVAHDKKFSDNKLVRNTSTGKYEVWTDDKGNTTDHPIDNAVVNSPDFLPNEDLRNNVREATFKIADNEWNKTHSNPEDIAIDVYYEDNFIGRLPAFKKGMPAHLLALRKAVMKGEASEIVEEALPSNALEGGQTPSPLRYKGANPAVDTIVTRTIGKTKQILLIRRKDGTAEGGKWAFPGGFQDTTAKKGEAWVKGKEDAKSAAQRELMEETGLSTKQLPKKSFTLVGTFDDRGRDPRNTEESWVESTVYRVELPEGTGENVKGMDDASDARWINIDELQNMPDSDFAFDHADILNKENLRTSRKQKIDTNFDTIIEQLAKSKVNVFFNENQEFKKCD